MGLNLDTTGWPELPEVGMKVRYQDGFVHYGVCTIVRADHVCNAAGKPGGRIVFQCEDNGKLYTTTLSYFRNNASYIDE